MNPSVFHDEVTNQATLSLKNEQSSTNIAAYLQDLSQCSDFGALENRPDNKHKETLYAGVNYSYNFPDLLGIEAITKIMEFEQYPEIKESFDHFDSVWAKNRTIGSHGNMFRSPGLHSELEKNNDITLMIHSDDLPMFNPVNDYNRDEDRSVLMNRCVLFVANTHLEDNVNGHPVAHYTWMGIWHIASTLISQKINKIAKQLMGIMTKPRMSEEVINATLPLVTLKMKSTPE